MWRVTVYRPWHHAAVQLLSASFSTYFAFLSRQIPAKFNEIKFLGVTLYSMCIIWLASIPTYFATVRFGVVHQMTSLLMAVLFSATTTLACLLLPKSVTVIWYILKDKAGKDANSRYTRPVETEIARMCLFILISAK